MKGNKIYLPLDLPEGLSDAQLGKLLRAVITWANTGKVEELPSPGQRGYLSRVAELNKKKI